MGKNVPDFIICFIIAASVTALYLLNKSLILLEIIPESSKDFIWIQHGLLNIVGYATIFLPGFLVYKYVHKINYIHKWGNSGYFGRLIKSCFGEEDAIISGSASAQNAKQRTALQEAFLLLFYFTGLQVLFLTWGILQEKVMTQEYVSATGEIEYFKDSQFLVFVNRILAFFMSGVIVVCKRQPRHKCPLYKYIFCSFSNIMSSWCQYEALKYVSFPHQVLAKAAKTIPVMIMGKIISRTKYEFYEYVTAVILSLGMLFFMLDTGNDRAESTVTTFSGVILLGSYIAFDSFTSNWQGDLFKQYEMKPIQMMCCVNLFSCIFTVVSLIQQGSFFTSLNFMMKYPTFIVDCVLLSVCSAGGQLFIFRTLADFGPLIFAIIATIRQGFSVLLSCIIYHHEIHMLGIFGLILVFFSILLRIYCGHRLKTIRKLQNKKCTSAQAI